MIAKLQSQKVGYKRCRNSCLNVRRWQERNCWPPKGLVFAVKFIWRISEGDYSRKKTETEYSDFWYMDMYSCREYWHVRVLWLGKVQYFQPTSRVRLVLTWFPCKTFWPLKTCQGTKSWITPVPYTTLFWQNSFYVLNYPSSHRN